MNITEQHKNSTWWFELKADLESRLAKLREENDKPSTVEETAGRRGQIKEVKLFIDSLGMGKPKPKIDDE